MPTAGLILCGGRSSRMGRDKAGLMYGNETALARIARLLAECVDRVAVVASPKQSVPQLFEGVLLIRDAEEGQGPLFGLRTGLDNLPADCDPIFLTACDAPFPQIELIRFLLAQSAAAEIVVPWYEGRVHPLFAVYRRSVNLRSGNGSMQDLIASCDHRKIGEEELRQYDPDLRSLLNVNTWEEYERAIELLE